MNERRLPDYLDPMQQAATDACAFVVGLDQAHFLNTQQAVIMMSGFGIATQAAQALTAC